MWEPWSHWLRHLIRCSATSVHVDIQTAVNEGLLLVGGDEIGMSRYIACKYRNTGWRWNHSPIIGRSATRSFDFPYPKSGTLSQPGDQLPPLQQSSCCFALEPIACAPHPFSPLFLFLFLQSCFGHQFIMAEFVRAQIFGTTFEITSRYLIPALADFPQAVPS